MPSGQAYSNKKLNSCMSNCYVLSYFLIMVKCNTLPYCNKIPITIYNKTFVIFCIAIGCFL